MSASLSEAKSESKSLQAARVRLSKLLEDLKLLTAEIAGLKDNSWGKKLGELENADQQLSGFLSEVRTQLAVPFPTDKQQEVPDLLAQLKELNEKASMREKAVKLIYKTSKSLLAQSLADDGDHAANEQQGQNLVERAEGPARGDGRLGLAGESEPQPGQDKLAALKTLRSTLRASLKRATQDFRNESRKRRRLLAKAGRLSQEDLLFLLRRQNA